MTITKSNKGNYCGGCGVGGEVAIWHYVRGVVQGYILG